MSGGAVVGTTTATLVLSFLLLAAAYDRLRTAAASHRLAFQTRRCTYAARYFPGADRRYELHRTDRFLLLDVARWTLVREVCPQGPDGPVYKYQPCQPKFPLAYGPVTPSAAARAAMLQDADAYTPL